METAAQMAKVALVEAKKAKAKRKQRKPVHKV